MSYQTIALSGTDPAQAGRLIRWFGERGQVHRVPGGRWHMALYDTRRQCLGGSGLVARLMSRGAQRRWSVATVPLVRDEREREVFTEPVGRGDPGVGLRRLVERRLPLRLRGVPRPYLELWQIRASYEIAFSQARGLCHVDRLRVWPWGEECDSAPLVEVEVQIRSGYLTLSREVDRALSSSIGLSVSDFRRHQRVVRRASLSAPPLAGPAVALAAREPACRAGRAWCRCLTESIRRCEPGTRLGLDPEYLHKMRVATRRLRTALGVFRPCMEDGQRRRLSEELSWLASLMGRVRDLDVFSEQAEAWQGAIDAPARPGVSLVSSMVRARREEARQRLLEGIDSSRYGSLLKEAEALFGQHAAAHGEQCEACGSAAALASKTLRKQRRRFVRLAKQCRRDHHRQSLHELRIAIKQLRYTAEFFGALYERPLKRFRKRIEALQEPLGRLQDCVVAGQLVSALSVEAMAEMAGCLEGGEEQLARLLVLGQLAGAAAATARQAEQQVVGELRKLRRFGQLEALLKAARKQVGQ